MKWIVVGLATAPVNLDPGIGLDEASQRVHQVLFSSLLKLDTNLRVVPDLAVRFETADWRRFVAAIPPGVRFHDGREMTADDVAFTFKRFLDPAFVSGRKGGYQDLTAVDVLDRYTVAFVLEAPSGAFPTNLANVGIVPTGSVAGEIPVGSGPFQLVEYVPDDHVTVAAFPDHYGGPPASAGLVFKVVPDETMRGLELRKGDIDLVVNDLSPDLVNSFETASDLVVDKVVGTDYAYVGMNLRDRVLADRRVRHAIGHAIDRSSIVHYLRRDQARETAGIIPPTSWAYVDDLFELGFDPARARALLDEAGYRDPDGEGPQSRVRLTLKTSTAEAYRLQAAVIQRQLADVGIALDLRSTEFATLFADVIRGNIQLYTLVFTGGSVADPDILRRVFHSAYVPPVGFNRAHYRNAEVDTWLDRANAALTIDDRRVAYAEAQKLIARDAPLISLWVRTNVAVSQRSIGGITLTPTGDFEFLKRVFRHEASATAH
jgi:peptide/nickel transport system substrate-binding protein